MSDIEFLKRYEELLDKGYCDCNEMNCIDNNSPRKILNIAKNQQQEIERLNNIINELKEWFKGYHKSYASCKWYEEDYIEFIEHLENELKGEDKE